MALRLNPAHGQARLGLGFVDFRRGDLESAERRLSAVTSDDDPAVAAALAHVRTALSGRVPVQPPSVASATTETTPDNGASTKPTPTAMVVEFPTPDPAKARHVFAPALEGSDQAALLVDADGLVLAGSYVNPDGHDVAEIVAAELAGVSGEAERAMRHLGLGAWTSMLVEADRSVVAMTPAPLGSLLVVSASRETPL